MEMVIKVVEKLSDVTDFISRVKLERVNLPEKYYEPDLYPTVENFFLDAEKRGVYIRDHMKEKVRMIKIVDKLSHESSRSVIATCNRFTAYETTLGGRKAIQWKTLEFHKRRFNNFHKGDPIKKKAIIYHECGHCYLDWVGHLPDGVYGIMSSRYGAADKRLKLDFKGLLDDMFSPEYRKMMGQFKNFLPSKQNYFYVNR